MMKQNFALAAGLVAALAAAPALAAPYLEIGAGMSRANADCAGTIACDTSSAHGRLVAGWAFGDTLAAEIGVAQLGKLSASATVPPVGRVDAEARLRSATLGAAARLPLTDALALTARLGVASNQTRVSGTAAGQRSSESQRHTAPYAGVGLSYTLSKTLSVGLHAESTRARYDGEDVTVNMAGANLRVAF
jgi:OmpA-OmpF porin, OOP family